MLQKTLTMKTVIKTTKALFGMLTITMALLAYTHAQAQSFLTNGLVAYYPLNGNANDSSGNGNNGTVVGAVPATDRFGNPNGCYSFNGNSQYIYAPADNMPTGPRTISLWFNANEVATEPQLLGYGGNGCGDSFFMGLNTGTVGPGFDVSSHCNVYQLEVPYTTPPTNAWYQWIVVMDDVGMTFYINGQPIGSLTGTTVTYVAGTQLGLGVISSPGGVVPYTDVNVGYLNGYLDDVRIYNRALCSNEVSQLYQIESGITNVPPPVVNINKAVWLSFSNLVVGTNYQVQVSTNLSSTFTNYGSPFSATNSSMPYPAYWNVSDWNQLFFQLVTSP
jgi:hypothetical protein